MGKQHNFFMSKADQSAFVDRLLVKAPDAIVIGRPGRIGVAKRMDWEEVRSVNSWSSDIYFTYGGDREDNEAAANEAYLSDIHFDVIEFTPSIVWDQRLELQAGRVYCQSTWVHNDGFQRVKSKKFQDFVKVVFNAAVKVCPGKDSFRYVGRGASELKSMGYKFES